MADFCLQFTLPNFAKGCRDGCNEYMESVRKRGFLAPLILHKIAPLILNKTLQVTRKHQ